MNKRLYKSENKVFTGVCGGIAEYFEIDSTLVRLGWIVLTFIPPFPGIIGYILASFIIPKRSF